VGVETDERVLSEFFGSFQRLEQVDGFMYSEEAGEDFERSEFEGEFSEFCFDVKIREALCYGSLLAKGNSSCFFAPNVRENTLTTYLRLICIKLYT
jgi:hypothetical protein